MKYVILPDHFFLQNLFKGIFVIFKYHGMHVMTS